MDNYFREFGFKFTAFLAFCISWIYCIYEYGYLLGVGLGWLPSLIVGFIVGALWPLVWLIVLFGGMWIGNKQGWL